MNFQSHHGKALFLGILGLQLVIYVTWNNAKTAFNREEKLECPDLDVQQQHAVSSTDPRDYITFWNMHTDLKNYWLQSRSLFKKMYLSYQLDTVNDAYVVLNDRIEAVMNSSLMLRQRHIEKIKKLIRQKIEDLQHPMDCSKARILICNNTGNCGFGCWIHILVNCLAIALKQQRTLIYTQDNWQYSLHGMEYAMLPLSNCSIKGQKDIISNERVVLENTARGAVADWLPWSIPAELSPTLQQIHGHPFGWWISQLTAYCLRYQPWIEKKIEMVSKRIAFDSSPIAGIHIRRGDKLLKEAERYEVEDYMLYVEQWFNQLALTRKDFKRTVFVATEDQTVIPELIRKYPKYKFMKSDLTKQKNVDEVIMNRELKVDMVNSRYNEEDLEAIIIDIQLLSQCDFLACTLSSSVCRTAYELMTYSQADATTRFQAVDHWYRFKTKKKAPWIATTDHKSANDLDIEVGDSLNILYDAHTIANDGYLRGENERTMESGKAPIYKMREKTLLRKYPILQDIKDELNTLS